MARDPVLGYVNEAQRAEQLHGIPADVLLGLIKVESGGNAAARSPAGAGGSTQFMPGTARSYGVEYGTSARAIRTQVEGAARYLKDLGFGKDARAALAKYNAGPAPGFMRRAGSYPDKVLGAAKGYKGASQSGGVTATGTGQADTSGGGSVWEQGGEVLQDLFLKVAFVLAGAALVGIGLSRLAGVDAKRVAAAAATRGKSEVAG